MAVTGGNCYSTYAKNTRFRIDWDKTGEWSDNNGCGSIIKWRLVLENRNQWYSNAVRCYAIYINGVKVHDGGTWSNFTSHEDVELIGWQYNVSIPHDNAGNEKTFNINYTGWFYSSYNVSASTDFTLPRIPRGTSITGFSVNKWNETELKFNWSTADNIDELWYSTDNGANWANAGISGTSSGYFFVSNLAPCTTYYCKISVKRNTIDTQSWQEIQTTYAIPNQWLVSATETTMTIGWSIDSDSTASHVSYYIDGTWVDVAGVDTNYGTYTIYNLAANTGHNISTLVRRKWAETDYASPTYWYSTYAYPYLTASQDFVIGNSVTVNFYNPLNRDLQIQMWSHGGSQFVTDLINVTGGVSQFTFTPDASRLYASIPNAKDSVYNIDVWYNNNKAIGQLGNKYIVNESASTPTFSNFEYKDTASNDLISAIDDDQVLVQNVSNVNVVISTANKMSARNSATEARYYALFDNLSKTFDYSSSAIDTNLGIPNGYGSKTFKVIAYDSRGLYTDASKNINIIQYSNPVINVTLQRLNNFEAQTTLQVAGTFSKVTVNNTDKNAIKTVKYRWKESTSSTWENWTTMTIASQGNGSYSTDPETLSFDNTKQFDFEIRVTDKANAVVVSRTLSIGKPLMFLHTSGKLEVNGEIQAETNVLSPSFESEQAHGFKTDTFFNFHHKDTTASDNWSICSNDGTGKFTVYPETGNTIVAGDLTTGNANGTTGFSINGGHGSNIHWKENGFGDKFNIVPLFGGADDDNQLHIQGAVGGAGEDPALYDLMTITGKSGNVAVKGNLWNGGDLSTNGTLQVGSTQRNTVDTWMPVLRNGYFDYTLRHITNGGTPHTDWPNNQDYVATLSTLSFWNGAYNSGNASNLRYGYQGEIAFKPTILYDNSSGEWGTVTLSDNVWNYSFIEVYYADRSSNDHRFCSKIYWPDGKGLDLMNILEENGDMRVDCQNIYFSGNTITRRWGQVRYLNGNAVYNVLEQAIFLVVGYK